MKIIVGQHDDKNVYLPRIHLCPSDDDMFLSKLKRKQLPIRLCLIMKINKAQGKTISNVGIYLPKLVLLHGKLYVALSKGTSCGNTKGLVNPVKKGSTMMKIYNSNVVYK